MPVIESFKERESVLDVLEKAEALIVFAGAGMSADAGIPVYRGENGRWKQEVELDGETFSLTELSTHKAFQDHYELAWKLMMERINLANQTIPHKGYHLLKEILGTREHFVVTSNIDSYFERSGFSENSIAEIHGSGRYFQCMDPQEKEIWLLHDGFDNKVEEPPTCPSCGGPTRPNIRLFEDWFWLSQRARDQEKRYVAFLKTITGKQVVILEIGAGKALPYLRGAAERRISDNVSFVRINPEQEPEHDQVLHIQKGTLDTIEELHGSLLNKLR